MANNFIFAALRQSLKQTRFFTYRISYSIVPSG